MWQPDPDWTPVPGGMGSSTLGLWRRTSPGGDLLVKRLGRPVPGDPPELVDERHFAYWRREADVARSGILEDTPGLIALPTAAEEDEDGITLTRAWVPAEPVNGLFAAAALGRFAASGLADLPWLATDQFRDRLVRVERRGGWPTLARTSVADVADHLWQRRLSFLARLDALPQVPQHGDPAPANLPAPAGDRLIAIDPGTLGRGPVGADLGLLALSVKEDFDHLLVAYAEQVGGLATLDQARFGAQVVAGYTALSRAEWALARAAHGEGALAAKFRHPSVAPYLLGLQRQFPQLEALLALS